MTDRRFYEAPDATQFAFAQNETDGLALTTLDMPEGRVTRYGALHQTQEAEGATPFAIAWSHDQRYIAVGPKIRLRPRRPGSCLGRL